MEEERHQTKEPKNFRCHKKRSSDAFSEIPPEYYEQQNQNCPPDTAAANLKRFRKDGTAAQAGSSVPSGGPVNRSSSDTDVKGQNEDFVTPAVSVTVSSASTAPGRFGQGLAQLPQSETGVHSTSALSAGIEHSRQASSSCEAQALSGRNGMSGDIGDVEMEGCKSDTVSESPQRATVTENNQPYIQHSECSDLSMAVGSQMQNLSVPGHNNIGLSEQQRQTQVSQPSEEKVKYHLVSVRHSDNECLNQVAKVLQQTLQNSSQGHNLPSHTSEQMRQIFEASAPRCLQDSSQISQDSGQTRDSQIQTSNCQTQSGICFIQPCHSVSQSSQNVDQQIQYDTPGSSFQAQNQSWVQSSVQTPQISEQSVTPMCHLPLQFGTQQVDGQSLSKVTQRHLKRKRQRYAQTASSAVNSPSRVKKQRTNNPNVLQGIHFQGSPRTQQANEQIVSQAIYSPPKVETPQEDIRNLPTYYRTPHDNEHSVPPPQEFHFSADVGAQHANTLNVVVNEHNDNAPQVIHLLAQNELQARDDQNISQKIPLQPQAGASHTESNDVPPQQRIQVNEYQHPPGQDAHGQQQQQFCLPCISPIRSPRRQQGIVPCQQGQPHASRQILPPPADNERQASPPPPSPPRRLCVGQRHAGIFYRHIPHYVVEPIPQPQASPEVEQRGRRHFWSVFQAHHCLDNDDDDDEEEAENVEPNEDRPQGLHSAGEIAAQQDPCVVQYLEQQAPPGTPSPFAPRILLINQQANSETPAPNRAENPIYHQLLCTPPSAKGSRLYLRPEDYGNYRGFDSFQCISDEIILRVFHHLPRHMMCTCALVCRRWARIVCDVSLWRRMDMAGRPLKFGILKILLERGVEVLRLNRSEIMGDFSSTVLGAPDPRRSPLSEDRMYRLQLLDMSMCNVKTSLVECMLRFCPNLRKISLENIPVTEQLLINLAVNSPYLETLNLCMCVGTTARGLGHIFENCTSLSQLNIAWTCMDVTNIKAVFNMLPHQLLALDFSGNRDKISDEDVITMCSRCPNLQDLDLSDSTEITSKAIDEIGAKLLNLRKISLSRCYSISPTVLINLSSLPDLQTINVFGMMRDASLSVLERYMKRYKVNKDPFSAIARPTPSNSREVCIWNMSAKFGPCL